MGFTSRTLPAEDNKQVVIDWSANIDEQTGTDENIEQMIQWIKTYPRQRDVHVYLGKSRQGSVGRKLQGMLLAMGCQVTTKQYVGCFG